MRREKVEEAISMASMELGELGRVLVRPSGTEPLVRVLVEAKNEETLISVSEKLFNIIRQEEEGNRSKTSPERTLQ